MQRRSGTCCAIPPAVIIAAALIIDVGCQTTGDNAASNTPGINRRAAAIARVVDGDTLLLDSGESVRLIGIDAPELEHAQMPAERFARDAAYFLRNLAEGRNCALEYEEPGAVDKYGRTLAYVYVEGTMLNTQMLRNGYALVLPHFPFRRLREFQKLEKYARSNRLGLWAGTLTDGRIANLATRYDALNEEGKAELDEVLTELAAKYPTGKGHGVSPEQSNSLPPDPVRASDEPEPADAEPDADSAQPWQKASDYIGQNATIKGTVVSTYKSATVCFLDFGEKRERGFYAVIFSSSFPLFPANPERHYKDRSVRITGAVTTYKGRPQIVMEAPSQIEIIE